MFLNVIMFVINNKINKIHRKEKELMYPLKSLYMLISVVTFLDKNLVIIANIKSEGDIEVVKKWRQNRMAESIVKDNIFAVSTKVVFLFILNSSIKLVIIKPIFAIKPVHSIYGFIMQKI